MLYAFFWAIPRRLNVMYRRFGTECSETTAYKIQTPGELPRRKHKTEKFLPLLEVKRHLSA
jgi:hypothetical protein